MTRQDFRFFQPFRVRYSEIDLQGVVFNAHYLTYYDTSISEYFRSLGFDQFTDAKRSGVDFHVVRSLVEYKAVIRLDQEIEVGVRVGVVVRVEVGVRVRVGVRVNVGVRVGVRVRVGVGV